MWCICRADAVGPSCTDSSDIRDTWVHVLESVVCKKLHCRGCCVHHMGAVCCMQHAMQVRPQYAPFWIMPSGCACTCGVGASPCSVGFPSQRFGSVSSICCSGAHHLTSSRHAASLFAPSALGPCQGLLPDLPAILLVGGGEGMGKLKATVEELDTRLQGEAQVGAPAG
jgi:hypothetical protein